MSTNNHESFLSGHHLLEDPVTVIPSTSREIGHEVAEWVEGVSRPSWDSLPKLTKLEDLRPGMSVAVPGFFSFFGENTVIVSVVQPFKPGSRTVTAESGDTFMLLEFDDRRGWVCGSMGNTKALERVDFI